MEITPQSIGALLYKISPKPNERKYTCYVNKNGYKVCYNTTYPNTIVCDREKCLVNYVTLDQTFLSKPLPDGVRANMYQRGYLSEIRIIGTFKRDELKNVSSLFPNIQIREVEKLGDPFFGTPRIPLKCKFPPFKNSKECTISDV